MTRATSEPKGNLQGVQFQSINKIGDAIQYVQLLIARVSALFLMLSLVTATWNLLVKDALFANLPWLEWVWGLAQALAVDSALAVVFVRMAQSIQNKEWVRGVVYGIVGLLLLFVAIAIIDVESLRQALEITLTAAAGKLPFHITIEFLTQTRSVVVGLLIAISGFELVLKPAYENAVVAAHEERHASTVSVPERQQVNQGGNNRVKPGPPVPAIPHRPIPDIAKVATRNGHATSSKLALFFAERPNGTSKQAARATGVSESTVSRWKKRHANEQLTELTGAVAAGAGQEDAS